MRKEAGLLRSLGIFGGVEPPKMRDFEKLVPRFSKSQPPEGGFVYRGLSFSREPQSKIPLIASVQSDSIAFFEKTALSEAEAMTSMSSGGRKIIIIAAIPALRAAAKILDMRKLFRGILRERAEICKNTHNPPQLSKPAQIATAFLVGEISRIVVISRRAGKILPLFSPQPSSEKSCSKSAFVPICRSPAAITENPTTITQTENIALAADITEEMNVSELIASAFGAGFMTNSPRERTKIAIRSDERKHAAKIAAPTAAEPKTPAPTIPIINDGPLPKQQHIKRAASRSDKRFSAASADKSVIPTG